jgi:toxin ParE1/3/4
MKLEFKLSKLALEDIEGIWYFTLEQWSKDQANEYYTLIIDEISKICINPKIGKSIKDIKPNHRIMKIKSHMIIYKIDRNCIYIDRILHERMDIGSIIK